MTNAVDLITAPQSQPSQPIPGKNSPLGCQQVLASVFTFRPRLESPAVGAKPGGNAEERKCGKAEQQVERTPVASCISNECSAGVD